jgi:pilus assembly protein CpaB
MNRNRMLIAMTIAILIGLAASMFVYNQIQQAAVAKPIAMQQVVVAALPLPLGTRLRPEHLRTVPWPADEPIQGMYARTDQPVNRALLTNVIENEPILEGKLAPIEAGGGLPATIPEGMRAVSVSVNDVVAVAGFVMPGTMVDVLVTGSVGSSGDQSITRTILENVRVLAAGQKIEQDREGKPQTVPVITLLVTPEQANVLTMASTEGKIQLALRNTIDTKRAGPSPILRTSLFGIPRPPAPQPGPQRRARPPAAPSAPPAAPAPPPPAPSFVVEVIHGDKRESKTFTLP